MLFCVSRRKEKIIHKKKQKYNADKLRDLEHLRSRCRMFSEGRTNVYDDDRSGCPSLVIADLLDQVNEKIQENRPCSQ
jgi:hypothetical protein